MKFTIVERKVKIEDELREYVVRKTEKLDRYFQKDTKATITFGEERGRHTVEITVNHDGIVFRAEETTTDGFASVDGAISSIERQIRKNKTRLEKRLRSGAFDKSTLDTVGDYIEDDYNVIRHKKFQVEPMPVDEAILQMNLLGHQFYFFRNSEDGNVHSVVYKRASGGYGIIEDNN